PTEEAPLATILLLSLFLSHGESFLLRPNSFILVLRLCGRACVAGEAKLPSDPSPKNEEEAMAGVGPMTQDWEPVVIHERVPTELKKAIMQARGEKKLTQSQLA
ncbi:hypothetical protein IGI04_041660, partial [Brassica rapa subsp. trilocularis]